MLSTCAPRPLPAKQQGVRPELDPARPRGWTAPARPGTAEGSPTARPGQHPVPRAECRDRGPLHATARAGPRGYGDTPVRILPAQGTALDPRAAPARRDVAGPSGVGAQPPPGPADARSPRSPRPARQGALSSLLWRRAPFGLREAGWTAGNSATRRRSWFLSEASVPSSAMWGDGRSA